MLNNDTSKQPAVQTTNGGSRGNGLKEGITSPPAISLPKGGGAIQGVGEKFQVNAVSGTGSLTVPLAISPGRGGFGPQLALSYDSGAGNGPFGIGWNVGVASIQRKTQQGLPQYRDAEESDVFILSGAEDLVPEFKKNDDGEWVIKDGKHVILEEPRTVDGVMYRVRRYRPRIEGLFARIERWVRASDGDVHWRSISSDNILTIYGKDENSRIADPTDPRRIFSWLMCETRDDKGNAVMYTYKAEDGTRVDLTQVHERNRGDHDDARRKANRYLKHIRYGNRVPLLDTEGRRPPFVNQAVIENAGWMFEVVFDYGDHAADPPVPQEDDSWLVRLDAFSTYRAGFEIRTYRLCHRVLMFHHFPDEDGVGKNCLVRSTDFTYDANPVATQLHEITHWSYVPGQDPAAMPPLRFGYTAAEVDKKIYPVSEEDLENLPQGLNGTYRWLDLDGEGLSGVLAQYHQAWYYKRNLGDGHFGSKEVVGFVPSVAVPGDDRQQFVDLGGDGQQNLVVFSPHLSGFYEWDSLSTAESFQAFETIPNLNWGDPNLRLIDLNGDGHADILITEHECFVWYGSKAKAGFDAAATVAHALDEERGPRVVFADATQTIFLADMSGDGLTDIVRIENGSICYWPNTGYGTFGAKICMDNAPLFDYPEYFDPPRIRLGDTDGSGTSDIFYLGRDGLHYWFNQAGNSWSETQELPYFPPTDRLTSVDIIDLLGNGTACIVWSSSLPGDQGQQLRYIPLMSLLKPYLLTEIDNNMGGLTRMQYAPSTRFYLEDRRNRQPWITKLPFPVHVLERVETVDQITGTTFVSRYVYHHGYFDGDEREFRGFGMVEQYDTEDFESFGEHRLFDIEASNWSEDSHVPPVCTKSWFHTGVYLGRDHVSDFFAGLIDEHDRGEYYREPGLTDAQFREQLLPDTNLPPRLSVEEEREACRALKGSLLRQEVYALDDSDQADRPYSVVENTYTIRREQPRAENRHAVFFVHPQQSLTYHYERNPTDPRLAHALTLAVDQYGNTTQSASIVYPRRGTDHPDEQLKMWVSYQEADYIHLDLEPDGYRIGLPRESRSYDVTGLGVPDSGLFSPEALLDDLGEAEEIPYEATPDLQQVQKRLLRHSQTLYYNADLTACLPLGEAGLHGLPCESYQLVFTPSLLEAIYEGHVDEAMLIEGGYRQRDGQWWAPSGRLVFDPARFYLPIQHVDPFNAVTTLTYDAHTMLLLETEDPLHNRVTAENDYRLLQPDTMTDPNSNQTKLIFDVRGMVIATVVMGKNSEGDTENDPTTRFEYDLFNWLNNRQPNFAHSLAREQHGPDNPRWQESYVYTGGLGQEILTKVQAEPGEAFARDENGALRRDANGELVQEPTDNRWVGNGRVILNNKGNPVKQYEPYFSSTHAYEDETELREYGVSPTLHYDPLGRTIRTDFPDGTLARVAFTPWEQISYDQNDTVLESQWYADRGSPDPNGNEPADPDSRAAWLAAHHAGTPARALFDTLGRPFVSIAHNIHDGADEFIPTHSILDIEGNPLEIYDGRRCEGLSQDEAISHLGNRVMLYRYAMGGLQLYEHSMDAGERWALVNVVGNPLYSWDSRNHRSRARYDVLQRPVAAYMQERDEAEQLVTLTLYGEAHPQAEALNLRGQVFQTYDQAGVMTNVDRNPETEEEEAYDFKGNLLRSTRRLASDYKRTVDWSALEGFLDADELNLDALETAAAPRLDIDHEPFHSATTYDALNRPTEIQTPDGSRHQPSYNEANLLESLMVQLRGQGNAIPFVENIDYNEKGQRELIEYGNGVKTRYQYDPLTFRLIHLYTRRGAGFTEDCGGDPPPPRFAAPDVPPSSIPCGLQNLHYTYDPVGNITEIRDLAQQEIFFRNQRVEPHRRYVYDALSRLIEATGREHIGQANSQVRTHEDVPILQPLPHPNDPQALRRYIERYDYDPVGNILAMRHAANGDTWTLPYDYDENNNYLMGHGGATPGYSYDAHGNMTSMPHLPLMKWDFRDQLQATAQQVVNGGTPETTYYVYDAAGQRVRKVTESAITAEQAAAGEMPRRMKERIYLGGSERYREYNGDGSAVTLERETVHVMDDTERVALVETRTQGNDGSPLQVTRFQLGNHLGSVMLEVDAAGAVISCEEYHPYGTSAYRAGRSVAEVSLKRYRYTGKERDEEIELYYHGARYYACWLGRWTAADPVGIGDGVNIYSYTKNNPTVFIDLQGTKAEDKLGPPVFDPRFKKIFKIEKKEADLQADLPFQFWNIFSAYTADRVLFGPLPKGEKGEITYGTFAPPGYEKDIVLNIDQYFVKTPDGKETFIGDPTEIFGTLMHEGLHAIAKNFGLEGDNNTYFDQMVGTHEYMSLRGEDKGAVDFLFKAMKDFDTMYGYSHSDEWYIAMIFKGSLYNTQTRMLFSDKFQRKIDRIIQNENTLTEIKKTEILLKNARERGETSAISAYESNLAKLNKEFDQELFESTRRSSEPNETKAVFRELPTKSQLLERMK